MNIALIFAGGTGKRMNSKSKPKQFLELNGKPIIIHTLDYFENHCDIDAIAVVCIREWIDYLKIQLKKFQFEKVKWIVEGGATGQESIYNGLKKIYDSNKTSEQDIVLIHDGVRPLISEKLISDNINSVRKYGSAVTVSPVTETIVCETEGRIKDILERGDCRYAKAPQSFYLGDLFRAHMSLREQGIHDMIDSASLMMENGYTLHVVEGSYENIKITTPSDFYLFRAIIEARENSQIWGI